MLSTAFCLVEFCHGSYSIKIVLTLRHLGAQDKCEQCGLLAISSILDYNVPIKEKPDHPVILD